MLKYEMDEKVVRQQVTNRGKREKKRKFLPQSLRIKIIKSSKVTKKERRAYLLKVWNMIRPKAEREKERKENQIKEKKKGREREKEREEKLFSPIVKIRKDEKKKKEKERIRQSVKKKGDERKVKWKKKSERKGERTVNWIAFFFLWYFYSSPFLLLSREVSRDGSQRRGGGNDSLSPLN